MSYSVTDGLVVYLANFQQLLQIKLGSPKVNFLSTNHVKAQKKKLINYQSTERKLLNTKYHLESDGILWRSGDEVV